MSYPKGDTQFEDVTIAEARECEGGWEIRRSDGWSLFMHTGDYPAPKAGMTLRVYGKGIGFAFRGLFLEGHKVFYRTAAEDEIYRDKELYGADAADWLARWDAGRSVFTVEMGGLGPGYEQCIQIAAAEVLRYLLQTKPKHSRFNNQEDWNTLRELIEGVVWKTKAVKPLGLSGAQWGAALQLSSKLYLYGPQAIVKKAPKDRLIQTSNRLRFVGEGEPEAILAARGASPDSERGQ